MTFSDAKDVACKLLFDNSNYLYKLDLQLKPIESGTLISQLNNRRYNRRCILRTNYRCLLQIQRNRFCTHSMGRYCNMIVYSLNLSLILALPSYPSQAIPLLHCLPNTEISRN